MLVFLPLLACNEVCAEQFSQLKEGSDAFIGKTIEPFLHDFFQGCWKVLIIGGIVHVPHVHACLINIQMIVGICGSIERLHREHFNFLG